MQQIVHLKMEELHRILIFIRENWILFSNIERLIVKLVNNYVY